jgi:hypothetical protein
MGAERGNGGGCGNGSMMQGGGDRGQGAGGVISLMVVP